MLTTSSRPSAIWITWEHQRRNRELARALDVPLLEIDGGRNRWLRYLRAARQTVSALRARRPELVFAQNPSVVLAALVCALRPLFGYRVVIDRHSNFDFADTHSGLFNRVSHYSLKRADLTIVTNEGVARVVREHGGRPFILPDRLPELAPAERVALRSSRNVVFVCTYAPDEPLEQVLDAAGLLPADVSVYVTGNDKRMDPRLRARVPANVVLTGFIPAGAYDSLLASANVVLELTTRDHTLLCGAYEALSAGTPLVLSNKAELTAYFHRGAIVTENRPPDIARAVMTALEREAELRADIVEFRQELRRAWEGDFQTLQRQVGLIPRS